MNVPTEITSEMTKPVRALCREWRQSADLAGAYASTNSTGAMSFLFKSVIAEAERRHAVYAAAYEAMLVARLAKRTGAPVEWAAAWSA